MFRRNVIEGFLCYFEPQWKRLVFFLYRGSEKKCFNLAQTWVVLVFSQAEKNPHNIDETGLLSTSIAW